MKKLILLFILISELANLNAQDIIIKKNGDEINTKIIEVGIEIIKFKKFDNLEGSIYTMGKNEIFLIKYENGSKDVFNDNLEVKQTVNTQKDYLRKGLHLGFHITPSVGKILRYNYDYGFGINSGADLSIYFNDYIGIKTGISYVNIPYKYSDYDYDYNYSIRYVNTNTTLLGMPIKFLLTTSNKIGFYLEFGLNVYYNYYNNNNYIYNGINGVVIVEETTFGLNIKTSKIISLNFGLANYYSFETEGALMGLQIGMLFNLANKI